jgi:hypothetical protein
MLSCPRCRAEYVIDFGSEGVQPLLIQVTRQLCYDSREFDPRHPHFEIRRKFKLAKRSY